MPYTQVRKPEDGFGQKVLKRLVDMTAERRFAQMNEAEQAGVPPEHTLQTLLTIYDPQSGSSGTIDPRSLASSNISTSQPGTPAPQPEAPPSPSQPPTSGAVAAAMGGQRRPGFYEPGSFNPETGVDTPPSLLWGLVRQTPEDAYYRARTNLEIKKARGREPLQVGEQEKIGLEYQKQRELQSQRILGEMQQELMRIGGAVGAGGAGGEAINKKIREGQSLMQDLETAEDLFSGIPVRGGPVEGLASTFGAPIAGAGVGLMAGGPLGAVGGGVAGAATTRFGRPSQETYNSYKSALSTKLGRFVGEERFSDQDRKVFQALFPTEFTIGKGKRGGFSGSVAIKFAAIRALVGSTLSGAITQRGDFSTRAKAMQQFVAKAKSAGFSDDQILQELGNH